MPTPAEPGPLITVFIGEDNPGGTNFVLLCIMLYVCLYTNRALIPCVEDQDLCKNYIEELTSTQESQHLLEMSEENVILSGAGT